MNTSSTGSSSITREFASAKILTQEEQKIMLGTCLDNVRKTTPLVHNITNYVTVNDVANILLACGASPIMSDEPEDVEDITSICGGLNINIGTLHRTSIDGMYRAGAKAASLGHKILLDPVGAGASHLRTSTAVGLMEKIPFTVIRGNISEIKTLALGSGTTKDNLEELLPCGDAFIIGTYFKANGRMSEPVCEEKVRDFMKAWEALAKK